MKTAAATLPCAMLGGTNERKFRFSLRALAPESIFGRREQPRDPEQMRQQLQERKEKLAASIAKLREGRTEITEDPFLGYPFTYIVTAMFVIPSILITITQPSQWPSIPASGFMYIIAGAFIAGYGVLIGIRKAQLRQVEKQESELPSAPAKTE